MTRVVPAGVSAGGFGGRCRVVTGGQARSFRVVGGRGARGGPAEIGGIVGSSVGVAGRGKDRGRAGPGTYATGVRMDK